jgi:hypothetical protein
MQPLKNTRFCSSTFMAQNYCLDDMESFLFLIFEFKAESPEIRSKARKSIVYIAWGSYQEQILKKLKKCCNVPLSIYLQL